MRRFAPMIALFALSGCALLDGFSGSDEPEPCAPDDVTCNGVIQHDCQNPLILEPFTDGTVQSVNTCGQSVKPMPLRPTDLCMGMEPPPPIDGPSMVMDFFAEGPMDVEICIFGAGGRFAATVSSSCTLGQPEPTEFQCLMSDGCQAVSLRPGPNSLIWQGFDVDICSDLELEFRPIAIPVGEVNCRDTIDNDGNGLTDCEDLSCQSSADCAVDLDAETCNGVDDGAVVPSLPPGLLDEFACPCATDRDCAGLGDGASPFLCHVDSMTGIGNACVPSCLDADWCGAFNLTCTMNGVCR